MSPRLEITRRGFVRMGGGLFVSALIAEADGNQPPARLDPTALSSWIEIRSDNSIIVRTGRAETGTGMSAFYAQVVAEELNIRPEAITLIMGDTDSTPDGGYSAGFLTGAANLRKVASYTHQALLALASKRLGVPSAELSVSEGIVAGRGKRISYGRLVDGQILDLKIPIKGESPRLDSSAAPGVAGLDGFEVGGDPPVKPIAQYKVVGKSYPMPGIPDKVTGKTKWSCDVILPGMLHARMVRPATLGSKLISIGALDKKRFPTAEVVKKGNLVAVVSPDECEAIAAARSVASGTKWGAWAGLPSSENLTTTLREHDWGAPNESRGDAQKLKAEMAKVAKVISASFEQPYVRHAPIGPFVAVADVKPGSVTVWTHSSHSQGLRVRIANLLGVSAEIVVVRWLDHSGQYGRTTFGGDGAEADAVILSQLTGKPVRVQWTLQEDLAWSSVSSGWVADIKAGLDANGRITALQSAFYSPHVFDARPLGAILAGMPAGTSRPIYWNAVEWPYDKIPNRLEQAFGMPNLGADTQSAGLRGNIMRTPGHRQQNFVLESLMNQAAAAVGEDPIRFRREHSSEQRLIDILNATAEAAEWDSRPYRQAQSEARGTQLTGRGVGVIFRSNAYWAGIAHVTVTPLTGVVQVTKFTIGIECGKIINPRQLDRCMKSGLVMGLSEAPKEEVTFDNEKVTSTDWSRYQILTMEETPEIKVVQISRDDKGFGVGGEAANAVAPPAVAAAFFDATGVFPHRIPLTPTYVKSLLKTGDAQAR